MEVAAPAPSAFPAFHGVPCEPAPSKPCGPAEAAALKLQKVYRSYRSRRSLVDSAVKLQKVYKSYRTRRRLADSAVAAEQFWWQALDYACLSHSTVSFFDYKPESVSSKWNRVGLNASRVGKGLSNDANALKLAFQHWIEAIDPRHRYGHNLHYYYDEWGKSDAGQPFFNWLDIGDGRNIDLTECPRTQLREQVVKYLGPKEREHYEIVMSDGKMIHKLTGDLLDTTCGSENDKWIFTMSTHKKLYVGKKKKGLFHHSSFLAGGATLAAGRLVAENGILKSIWAHSGHYRPSDEDLEKFISFLCENGVDRNGAQINTGSIEDYHDLKKEEEEEEESMQGKAVKGEYKRSLSGGIPSARADVPPNAILTRIESKEKARSYQLGDRLSRPWSTGAGPRIGCVKDYPPGLRTEALEFVSLSPR